MADCFLMKNGSSTEKVIPDIYNHGNIVGLNIELFNYNSELVSNKYNNLCAMQTTHATIDIDDTHIFFPVTGNKTLVIPFNINAKGYKYLCIDVEIKNGVQGQWNASSFGVIDTYNGAYEGTYKVFKYFTDSYHNEPYVYNFPRQIVKFDIFDLDEICIGGHNCDCEMYIYSIYLSNDEDEGV